MAVEDDKRPRLQQWLHRGGLLGIRANGDEALPFGVLPSGAGAIVAQPGGGDLEGLDDGGGGDACLVHSGGGRDDRNNLHGVAGKFGGDGVEFQRQNLLHGKALRGKDTVEAFEREGAFTVEEVGDVRLLEPRLAGQQAAGQRALFDAPEEFLAEEFVKILEVHRGARFSRVYIIQQDED